MKKTYRHGDYLRALFFEGEHVGTANIVQDATVCELSKLMDVEASSQLPQFVSVNPIDGATDHEPTKEWHRADRPRRADANVTAFRNLLFEFDQGTIEEQLEEIVEKEVPYTTLVYSGGKSIHLVIALTEGVSRSEYDELWKLTHYVLWKSDQTAKNPSRLTRLGGATRTGGIEQEIVDIRRRISPDRYINWLSKFVKHIERCEQRERERLERRAAKLAQLERESLGGLDALSDTTLKFLSGEAVVNGSRHARLVGTAFELRDCGVEFEEALALLSKAADLYGITSDPKRVNEAEEVATYVYSKA